MTTVVEGELIKTASNPAVYVVHGGMRQHVPDPQTFDLYGFNWGAVQTIDDASMAATPQGPELSRFAALYANTGLVPLSAGGGHLMETIAGMDLSTGVVTGVTHTLSVVELAGFEGGLAVVPLDNSDPDPRRCLPVEGWNRSMSPVFKTGVGGRFFGGNERHDPWTLTFPMAVVSRTQHLGLFQTDAAGDLNDTLNKWTRIAGALGTFVSALLPLVQLFFSHPVATSPAVPKAPAPAPGTSALVLLH